MTQVELRVDHSALGKQNVRSKSCLKRNAEGVETARVVDRRNVTAAVPVNYQV
jgi:hypothetical protein